MKKFKILLLMGVLVLAVLSMMGCNAAEAPVDLKVNEEFTLTWSRVEQVRNYVVEVVSKDLNVRVEQKVYTNSLDLNRLNLQEGHYEIRVKAIPSAKGLRESPWSEVCPFDQPYRTGLIYTLVDNATYTITGAGTATGEIVIEDEYRNKPVTAIGPNAFKNNVTITKLTLGKNITTIGDAAFYGCVYLESIEIPDTVTSVGKKAFQSCRALTEINIPDSLTFIDEYAYSYCVSIEKFDIPDVEYIAKSAFTKCFALKEVTIPESVLSIGEEAFNGCSALEKVNFNKNVRTLGKGSFSSCSSLKELNFPESCLLETVGESAFEDCSALERVVLPPFTKTICTKAFFGCGVLAEVDIPAETSRVEQYAFGNTKLYNDQVVAGQIANEPVTFIYADDWLLTCRIHGENIMLTEISPYYYTYATYTVNEEELQYVFGEPIRVEKPLKDGIVGIACNAFTSALGLLKLETPGSLVYINDYAFAYCPNLWRVVVPANSVEVIGSCAFTSCSGLTNLNLGYGVRDIQDYAFLYCTLLDNNEFDPYRVVPETVEHIGADVFEETALWSKPEKDTAIYAGNWIVGAAIKENSNLPVTIDIREETKGIADYAFFGYSTLTDINGLYNIEYIGQGAFFLCEELQSVIMNDNLTEIGAYTFYGCASLFNLTLPEQINKIGRSAFYRCQTIDIVDFSETQVSVIEPFAFYGCTQLRKLVFPQKEFSIGEYAFYGSSRLADLVLPGQITAIGDRAFANGGLVNLTVEDGVTAIPEGCFKESTRLKNVTLADSVQSIGDYAFYQCTKLKNITLGASLTSIGKYAFYNAVSLKNIVLPTSLEVIDEGAFMNAISLQSVFLPVSIQKINANAFYRCMDLTVFTDAESADELNWNYRWNSTHRVVVYNATFSYELGAVDTITVTEDFLDFFMSTSSVIGAPSCAGYRFMYWQNASGDTYSAADILNAPVGETFKAVWMEAPEEEEEEPEDDLDDGFDLDGLPNLWG